MPKRTSVTGSELFIVDNSDTDWKALRYLHDWCQLSRGIDVATAYFEIGSLLGLNSAWQKVDQIRILMGDEVSLRTRKAFEAGLRRVTAKLDESLEVEKDKNEFLVGVPAIVDAIRSGKIQCRVYRRQKFHAKAYITHARIQVVGSAALVGSSNFTYPGLTENIELNVQITGAPVSVLQEWYEEHWNAAEDVTADILRTLERHTVLHSPFEIWFKALDELLRGEALTPDLWDRHESKVFPILDKYQQDAYKNLVAIAEEYGGAFLCDGVGLGKTYVGSRQLNRDEFDVDAILDDTLDDLNQIAEFLNLVSDVRPDRDDKLKALIKLLKTDRVLKKDKVILFTEFADTARYIEQELKAAGISGVERIDGGSSQRQRSDVIRRFSPYYNESSSDEIAKSGAEEIRVLVSTDVLSEGLNLQDATRLINYDLHWNPVRLMQRIGRVDRRMSAEIEARILADHPEQKGMRGLVEFWNFLPPEELDELLRLFQRVTNKTIVISRTLGIEGRKLLTPDDEFDPVKEINEQCDGTLSELEKLRLEYNALVAAYPELAAKLAGFPLKVYSGKVSPQPNTRAVFFCYRIPRPDPNLIDTETGEPRWSDAAGVTSWVCYDMQGQRILTEPGPIAELIRSDPETPRHCSLGKAEVSNLRKKVERQLTNEYLRPLQAPVGVSPILKAWMEMS